MGKTIKLIAENILVIWAWTCVALFAVAVLSTHANALTLKSGEVLTSDGQVVHASESENTLRMIERDGYAIAGGYVHLETDGAVVSIDTRDLAGKSKDQISDVVGEAVADSYGLTDEEFAEIANNVSGAADSISDELSDKLSHAEFQAIVDEISDAQVDAEMDWFNSLTEEQQNADTRPDGTAW